MKSAQVLQIQVQGGSSVGQSRQSVSWLSPSQLCPHAFNKHHLKFRPLAKLKWLFTDASGTLRRSSV